MTLAPKSKTKQILVLAVVLAASLVLFLKFSYERARESYFQQQVEMLSAIADIQARGINILLEGYLDKGELIASRTQLRRLLATTDDDPSPLAQQKISKIIQDAADGDTDFALIAIYNRDGYLSAHTRMGVGLAAPNPQLVAADGDDSDFSKPFIESNFNQGQLQLSVYVPMMLDGQQIGVVHVNLTPSAIGRAIKHTLFGKTGEVVLGLHDQFGKTHLITRINEGDETGITRSPEAPGGRIAIYEALKRNEAVLIGNTTDRDGIPVVAVTRYLPELDWGLIAKIDESEIEGALVEIRNDLILIACLLFIPGVMVCLYFGYQLEQANKKLHNEQYNATLERADRRFRTVFTHSPVAMLMVRMDGSIEFANEEAESILEYEPGGLNGQPVDSLVPNDFRGMHAQWRDRFNQTNRDQVHYTMAANRDLTAQTRNGNLIPVTIGLTPIVTEQGPMVVAAISDLTERKAAHERIKAHAEALQRSNEELDRFAYVASHDLKAPLQGIAQLASMIEEDVGDALPPESREDLRLLQNRVSRLKNLLNSLLQYSRIGRIESEPEIVMPADMLRELSGLLLTDNQFRLEIDAELPPVFVPRAALELVFRNLISNTIKHHDRDTGRILVSGSHQNDKVTLDFVDDGPGIAIEFGERIFEMFQTLKRRDEIEGSGMGLALVKKTVGNLGGSIELVEREGRGACFRLMLPAAEPRAQRLSA